MADPAKKNKTIDPVEAPTAEAEALVESATGTQEVPEPVFANMEDLKKRSAEIVREATRVASAETARSAKLAEDVTENLNAPDAGAELMQKQLEESEGLAAKMDGLEGYDTKKLGFLRADLSEGIQRFRGKANIKYRTPDGRAIFAKYVTKQDGQRDNLAGLKREKHLLDKLAHTGVVPKTDEIKTYGERKSRLIMEQVPGSSLDRKEMRSEQARENAEAILRSTARALGTAHENGVALVDVKEGNFLVDQKDDGEVSAKVIDFELGVDLDTLDPSEVENSMRFLHEVTNKDVGIQFDKMRGNETSTADMLKKADMHLWAQAMTRWLLPTHSGLVADYRKPEGLSEEKENAYQAAVEDVSSILMERADEKGQRDYKRRKVAGMLKEGQTEETFITFNKHMAQGRAREIALSTILPEKLQEKGIDLSPELVNFLQRALSHRMEERPSSFSELTQSTQKKEVAA
ncbi:MAG: hypothetical protein O2877_01235 [bacterium]|nr:hypothetical protein [bacterium]